MVKVVQSTQEAPATEAHTGVESLDQIAAMGDTLEAPALAAGPAGPDPGEAAKLEIAAALELLRAAALPFAPEHVQNPLGLVWNDKQLERIASAIVDLCEYHGWTVGEFFTEYGPYLQLLAALGMPVLATLKILKMPPPAPAKDGQQ